MKCERCSKDIRKGQAVQMTCYEADGSAGPMGQETHPVTLMLCRPCARKRGHMVWFLLLFIAVLIVSMFLIGRLT